MRNILTIWFLATGAIVASALIWAFVPLLVPVLGITAGLGVLVGGIVALARWIERLRGGTAGG